MKPDDGDEILEGILGQGEGTWTEVGARVNRVMPPKISLETPSEQDKKDDKENYVQWALGGNGKFTPVGSTIPKLAAGVYEPFANMGSWGAEQMHISSDGFYTLPDMATETILAEVSKFWASEHRYRKHNLLFKRGLLLWGPPGSGKTITVKMLMASLIALDGIVIMANNVNLTTMVLKAIRRIEPLRNIIVVMEDIDEIIDHNGEGGVLSMLDGENNIDRVLNLATCHSPDTRFLTKDLRWVPCGDLKVGDRLWAFDEERPAKRGGRRAFRETMVTESHRSRKECVKLHFESGDTLICSTDHKLLAHKEWREKGTPRLEWTNVLDTCDMNVVRPFLPWDVEQTWESGWLAGILDGEGSIPSMKFGHRRPANVTIAQNIGPTATRIKNAVLRRVPAHVYIREGKQQIIDTTGGLASALKLIGSVRANRLIERVDLSGSQMHSKFHSKVIKVERLGLSEVQSIQTSTKTYIAEGFASHNTNYPERLGARIINRPSRFDRRVYIGMPEVAARRAYLQKATNDGLTTEQLDTWVKDTNGMSIAHLRELVAAVYCLDQPYNAVIRRLVAMAIQVKSKDEFKRNSLGFKRMALDDPDSACDSAGG